MSEKTTTERIIDACNLEVKSGLAGSGTTDERVKAAGIELTMDLAMAVNEMSQEVAIAMIRHAGLDAFATVSSIGAGLGSAWLSGVMVGIDIAKQIQAGESDEA